MATPVGPLLHPQWGGNLPAGMVHAGRGGLVKTVQATPGGETNASTNNVHGQLD